MDSELTNQAAKYGLEELERFSTGIEGKTRRIGVIADELAFPAIVCQPFERIPEGTQLEDAIASLSMKYFEELEAAEQRLHAIGVAVNEIREDVKQVDADFPTPP